jgi:LysM repeat protein
VPRPVASPATTPGADVYHTVQPGENLFRIALQYGTSVDAIVAANHLPDGDSVRSGQELLIPVGGTVDASTYVVQAGDTLYAIARRYGTTAEALASLNGFGPSDPIAIGQTLRVP